MAFELEKNSNLNQTIYLSGSSEIDNLLEFYKWMVKSGRVHPDSAIVIGEEANLLSQEVITRNTILDDIDYEIALFPQGAD